jgi:membrane protease YdiL (CAAX protease family)
LAGTLAAPSGSGLFYALGLLSAVIWIAGAFLSGPIPVGRRWDRTGGKRTTVVVSVLVGVALFLVFVAATRVAARIPALSDSMTSILDRADAGPRALVLAVALINGVGEEVFFRGAVPAALGPDHRDVWTVIVYGLVTVATLNLALVVAAVVMGTVFSAERRASGGVLAPSLTHVTWSALMILLLPRF